MSGVLLRCELFVTDLEASAAFYRDVLGFEAAGAETDGHLPLALGAIRLSLQPADTLSSDHHLAVRGDERRGVGVELVLEVGDLGTSYERVVASGYAHVEPLVLRAWGVRDFRVVDPDGYYLRVTETL